MSDYNIKVAVRGTNLGEGPHWVEEKQELIYVDIPDQCVNRYVPSTGKNYTLPLDGRTTFIVPVEGQRDKYLVGVEREIRELIWNGEEKNFSSMKKVLSVEESTPRNRFNDGKCDPQGRLWAGTMGYETDPGAVEPEKANLYSLDLKGQLHSHVDKIGISNGLTWTTDGSKFFYIDSVAFSVDVFDFDASNGSISNRKVLYDFKGEGITGLPDGMTTDANNNIWVAVHCGGKVLHIDTHTGALRGEIDFSSQSSNLTSVAFGGPHLDSLFVTSAKFRLSKEQLSAEENPGALFEVTNLGVKGVGGGIPFKGQYSFT